MPYVVSTGFSYAPSRRDVQWYVGIVEWPSGVQTESVRCEHRHATAAEAKRCAAEQREAMVRAGSVYVREGHGQRLYLHD